MDWGQYKKEFTVKAIPAGLAQNEIDRCLEYAKRLISQDLPVIYDYNHFCGLVGFEWDYVYAASNAPHRFYRDFRIKKKAGGFRDISEPLPGLKEIQRWVLVEILNKCAVSAYAKAYCPGKSIKDGARFHKSQKQVLALDVEDFFGQTPITRVFSFFHKLGYSRSISGLIANLCCLHGCLPQGAPTSPALSNLLNRRLDARLAGYCSVRKIRYTRYADDMAFSGEFEPGELIRFVREVLRSTGYVLNEKKTRLMKPHQRQEVTGIVVNGGMHAPRATRRSLRQSVYYIHKYGIDSHLNHTENMSANHVNHLKGLANFILFVNPKDVGAAGSLKKLQEMFPAKYRDESAPGS